MYIISVFTYYYHYILLYPWFEVPELAKSPAGSRYSRRLQRPSASTRQMACPL